MFKFCNLYSGSSGNSSYIESDNCKLLIDCGMTTKKIEEALESINVNISEIDGILITHEHSDHVKGLSVISKKYNIPIYANHETMKAIKQDLSKSEKIHFENDKDFSINDLKIHPFSIPHDAANPVAYCIHYNNTKATIATDIGHITENIFSNLINSDFLLLESNYENNLLMYSKYPNSLKKRILGPYGHLSNDETGDLITKLLDHNVSNIMLGHLSKENNFPELAYQSVMEKIISSKKDYSNLSLSIADRDKPNNIIEIKPR